MSMSRVAIAPDTDKSVLRVDVVWPSLWWPRGYGKQPRYDLELTLQDRDGAVLDQTTRRFGFRTIRLSTQPDEIGAEFVLHVNDRPIFCKGANWIPDSLFPAEVTQARYLQRIRQAVDANMNMLRVWGGGIYESDSFYDACDEYGVLVWQDFMFACAMYPEESPLRALVVAEAEYAVSRISHHPCVALWCGGNECVWAHESWGFGQRLRSGQSWGSAYYYDELPQAVCDARIPYWPNSPYSGATTIPANDEHFGNRHVWDTWGEGYRQTVPRFCSEFGHQSPPNYATLREALPELELQLGSRAMEHRQRASGGNAVRYDQPLAEWFRSPRDFDEWHFAAQLLAARSVATGIEWWRAHQPRCMGVLFWQLNDVWAGHSWSAVDVAGRRKLLWYAARRAFAPRLLTIQPMDGQLRLVLVNDTDDEWTASALVRRVDFDGRVLGEASYSCDVARRGVHLTGDLASQVGGAERKTREVIVADCDGLRATWYFAQDRELDYPQPQFAGEIERNGAECRVRITAQTLLRDVCFQFDRVWPSAEMSDQLITLLPGESASFSLTGDIPPSAEIYRRPLMWCAN